MGQYGLNGYNENVDDKESKDCLLESDHIDNGKCKIFCLNCWLSQYKHFPNISFWTKCELCTYRHSIYQCCRSSLWTPYTLSGYFFSFYSYCILKQCVKRIMQDFTIPSKFCAKSLKLQFQMHPLSIKLTLKSEVYILFCLSLWASSSPHLSICSTNIFMFCSSDTRELVLHEISAVSNSA